MKFLVLLSILLSCFVSQADETLEARRRLIELNEKLYDAIVDGNTQEANRLLDAGADPH